MDIDANLEKDLVKKLNKGDQKAFSYLFSLYKNQVFYYCVRYVENKEIAEDLTQDVFLAVWNKREVINADISFSAFLYTITRNLIYDTFRALNTRSRIYRILLEHAVDYTEEVERNLEEKNIRELLQKALKSLTERQKEVFILSREKGLSHKEIAQELGISVYTVQDHMKDALEKIRAYLLKFIELYPIVLWVIMLKYIK